MGRAKRRQSPHDLLRDIVSLREVNGCDFVMSRIIDSQSLCQAPRRPVLNIVAYNAADIGLDGKIGRLAGWPLWDFRTEGVEQDSPGPARAASAALGKKTNHILLRTL